VCFFSVPSQQQRYIFLTKFFQPLLHLEGTGDVLPIVSERIPKTIAKIYSAKQQLEKQHPQLYGMETPDMSIQMHDASPFYKFAMYDGD
jgi:hypothetical protein